MMNARINSFKIFREVAEDIYKKIDKKRPEKSFDYIIAFTVNCSFSCELGLKAIIAERYSEVKGHFLDKLFDQLEQEQKNFIIANMPSLADKSETSKEFRDLITTVSNNYVDWRYYYEKDLNTNWLFLYELMNAINLYFDGNNYLVYLESLMK